MNEPLKHSATPPAIGPVRDLGRSLGGLLAASDLLPAGALLAALAQSRATGAPLGQVILAQGLLTPAQLLPFEGRRHGLMIVDRATSPPDGDLAGLVAPEICLSLRAMPWKRIGRTLVIAAASPEAFAALRAELGPERERLICALATETDIEAELALRHGAHLARRAETSVPADESCRDLNRASPAAQAAAAALSLGCIAALALWPALFFGAVVAVAALVLVASELLRVCAALAAPRGPVAPVPPLPRDPVTVSLLVPLYREAGMVEPMLQRLARLDYPKPLLDVIFVLEACDRETVAQLSTAGLPPWARMLVVPDGPIQTKPRALNYALRFARGTIVGVLDAEDAPAANQISRVVAAFHAAPPQTACLQGILDFYNPHANWLSRCFTIEYASWFRMVLPGLCRLGLTIPLGGTSVYFRRSALEAVNGWDAHNVTEDADLGLRLARHGYRAEMLPTVTREEANNRVTPWIRQRSRWLKGYMITWAVHSRRPVRLWRDVGPKRFIGIQVMFLGAWLQFLLAPLLWLFWLMPLGWRPPGTEAIPAGTLVALFLTAQALAISIGAAAVARTPHRGLMAWVPTMILYFPLGVAAALKALWEVFAAPFYWDKTAHGASPPDHPDADIAEA